MRRATERAIDLYFLDECGFAPTLPTTYTWARVGTRVVVPYVAPQGRRVNVIGALAPYGSRPRLTYHSRTEKIDSAAFVDFLWREVAQLPAAPGDLPACYRRERPCVIVLDNYSVHRSARVKEVIPPLAAAGVTFFYLPPSSPELNDIEHLWRHIKHEDLPVRSFSEAAALKTAVDSALDDHSNQVAQSTISLCEAA
jgi:DDE superfamily endonuclease